MTAIIVSDAGTLAATTAATTAWRRRVLRVGGLIQATFASFWLVRGSLAIDGDVGALLGAALGGCSAGVLAYGAAATAEKAPRPTGLEAARLEDMITPATIVQLVASFVAPAVVASGGYDEWVLPAIAITIGALLLWLDHVVDLPRYRRVGWALIAGPVLLASALDGAALTATIGLAAGTMLLVTAAAGFHQLARNDRGIRSPESS